MGKFSTVFCMSLLFIAISCSKESPQNTIPLFEEINLADPVFAFIKPVQTVGDSTYLFLGLDGRARYFIKYTNGDTLISGIPKYGFVPEKVGQSTLNIEEINKRDFKFYHQVNYKSVEDKSIESIFNALNKEDFRFTWNGIHRLDKPFYNHPPINTEAIGFDSFKNRSSLYVYQQLKNLKLNTIDGVYGEYTYHFGNDDILDSIVVKNDLGDMNIGYVKSDLDNYYNLIDFDVDNSQILYSKGGFIIKVGLENKNRSFFTTIKRYMR